MSCCNSYSSESVKQDLVLNAGDKLIKKIILLGDSSIGKTSLLNKIVTGEFGTTNSTNLIACVHHKFPSGTECMFWDTAGQERFAVMIKAYFRDVDIALICFDVSNISTLESISRHSKSISEISPSAEIIILGLKADLSIDPRATNFMNTSALHFTAISSKTGQQIPDLITRLEQLC